MAELSRSPISISPAPPKCRNHELKLNCLVKNAVEAMNDFTFEQTLRWLRCSFGRYVFRTLPNVDHRNQPSIPAILMVTNAAFPPNAAPEAAFAVRSPGVDLRNQVEWVPRT